MKTKILLIMLLATNISLSQIPTLWKCKPDDYKHGISNRMVYESIIKSNYKPKDLIKKIKDYLVDSRLIEEKNIKIDQIDNKTKQFTLPFCFRQGVYFGKGMMGARLYKAPVYLYFDATFRFDDFGNIGILFTNFKETPFYCIKDGKFDNETVDPKVLEIYTLSTAETSFITKALILLNGGLDNYNKTIVDINKELDNQFKIYDDSEKRNTGKWFKDCPNDLFSFYSDKYGGKYQLPMAKERAENGYLIAVDNERWDNYFEGLFNGVFIDLAKLIDGNLIGINKDGFIKYNMENGKLKKNKK